MGGRARDIVIVGAGVFGTVAALELARRGNRVRLLESGRVPDPRASSTDISKLVRMDYGADPFYTELAERALEGWRRWNREGTGAPERADGGHRAPPPGNAVPVLFHETGLLVLAAETMRPGGFEHDSWRALTERGHRLQRLDAASLSSRFPLWAPGRYSDGYYNPAGGWVESGRAVAALAAAARAESVEVLEHTAFQRLLERGSRLAGVRTTDGEDIATDRVLVCAGAWTPLLLPWLEDVLRPAAQPVLHFRPERPEPWRAKALPPWCADIARTGWYGFPLHPSGVVKVGHHGEGWPVDPRSFVGETAGIPAGTEDRFRGFLSGSLPALAEAPLAKARVCLYCDTPDGDFWIGVDPAREGLVVAAGGSGHGFKFAPVLGPLIADAVEGKTRPETERLGWRRPAEGRAERARAR